MYQMRWKNFSLLFSSFIFYASHPSRDQDNRLKIVLQNCFFLLRNFDCSNTHVSLLIWIIKLYRFFLDKNTYASHE